MPQAARAYPFGPHSKRLKVACAVCGVDVWNWKSKILRHRFHFCSPEHKAEHQVLLIVPKT